ncbi:MAG: FAD-dependent oxidoreductase [Planctomycetota bacterium]
MIQPAHVPGKVGAVMVVGGGIGGIQASLDLANAGYKVYLVEETPAIGGKMAQLDKTFPTNDCSMCIMSPKLVECGRHRNIELLTWSEVHGIEGAPGDYTVRVWRRPKYIDPKKCTGCADCEKVCPVEVPSEFEAELRTRKAAFRRYTQAFPNVFTIDKKKRPPCQTTCPAGMHAQGYVALIREGRYQEAYELVRRNNPFVSVCGRVCTHPCEDKCRRAEYDTPVAIRELKRFAADWVRSHASELKPVVSEPVPVRAEKVAVIGSGPAGLTCAFYLAEEGYPVTVFEELPKAGGMLRYGIPQYRLPEDVLDWEIAQITQKRVTLKTGTRVASLTGLKAEGYAAVFYAGGAHAGIKLAIEGADAVGVMDAVHYLRQVKLGGAISLGRKVGVVGGGNSAIDAARTARRAGCDVQIIYRRTRAEMPANDIEITEALEEGIALTCLANPIKVHTDGGRIRAVECIRMELGEPDKSGRQRPVPVASSEFTIALDSLIFAVNQQPDLSALAGATAVKATRNSTLEADPLTMQTAEPWVFAGGDIVLGPSTAIASIAQGREAAQSISRFLRGADLRAGRGLSDEEPELPRPARVDAAPREKPAILEPAGRVRGFDEVEQVLTEEQAKREAGRCLECGLCSECLACEYACKAKAVQHGDRGRYQDVNVGAVILMTGADVFDPAVKNEYGLTRCPDVVTSLQFERIMSASGPFGGHIQRLSDGTTPRRIGWVQCVGSRDMNDGNDYCSAVCCMYAAKEAVIAREHIGGNIDMAVFYMDIRAAGKEFDRYIERARSEYGVRFIPGRVADIQQKEGGPVTVCYAPATGGVATADFDLVVLSAGFRPGRRHAALCARLDVRTETHDFIRTGAFAPVDTSRPGIFAAGVISAPKDIPETVMEASAAAARAGEFLTEARGTAVRPPAQSKYRDITGEAVRIGAFICHCGINIGGIVNVPEVVAYVKALDDVVLVEENLYTCSQDTQERIKEKIVQHGLNRILVASCTPRTHEPLFQETLKEAGLNPNLFELVNIRDQNSWVHMLEPARATAKAKDLVRMAIARLRAKEAVESITINITKKLLVVGGGPAGMNAALSAARQGVAVFLMERTGRLGGAANAIITTLEGHDVQAYLRDLTAQVKAQPNLTVFLNATIKTTAGFIGNYVTTIAHPGGETQIEHGAVILATGGSEARPDTHLHGTHPAVMTQKELEERLGAGGATGGHTAMIQCVGQRDAQHPWCSRVCCTAAVKHAIAIKTRDPKSEVVIFYRDIRTYGLSEQYYRQARGLGVLFIRYEPDRPPAVRADGSGVRVRFFDALLGREVDMPFDRLVLSARIDPDPSNTELAQHFKVPLTPDGFFLEAHMKLRPVDFATDGIFMAGMCHLPKHLNETIVQAYAAAGRAMTILARDTMEVAGTIASVTTAICSACGNCERVCPYNAIKVVEKDMRGRKVRHAEVTSALCKGCGACTAACWAKAVDLKGFSNAGLVGAVEEF